MSQNITLLGASYTDVPAVTLPKTGGGTATFYDTTIASNAAAASDIASGKLAYVNGSLITGTNSGGGGSGWTLLYTGSVTANTTATSATSLKSLATGVSYTDKNKIYLVTIRGDSGKRSGYFYGSDSYIWAAQNTTYTGTFARNLYYVNSSAQMLFTSASYGVYVYRFYYAGEVRIYTRYSSTYGTINDTFTVKVWSMDFPTGTTPAY